MGKCRGQALFQFGDSDVVDDIDEEPESDESTRFGFGDATCLKIEQVFVVQSPGRARVTGTRDIAGFNLEIRNRIRARAVG
jgi:hypothetical protein